jgi:hypothetical protein
VNRPSRPDDSDADDMDDMDDRGDMGDTGDTAHDLLGHARRRLPPEVDVVELASTASSEGDEMTASTTLSKAAVPLLAGAVALSGCGPSPDEIRTNASGSKAEVVRVSRDVVTELTGMGRLLGPAEGMWRSCRDKAGWLQYFVTGRLDPAPASAADDVLVDRVRSALAPRGYRLAVVEDTGEVLTLEAVTGDVNVQVTGYAEDPFVLFDISGTCVEVGELDGEFRYELPETVS